ncbi:MAG: hypothetical protein AAF553_06060 [Pseudomonadota bacterium]
MLAPFTFPRHVSDQMLAGISALTLTLVLMATAIVPASPAIASSPLAIGVLA